MLASNNVTTAEKKPTADKIKTRVSAGPRDPFLESPGNFTGPKSNIQIEI